MRVVPAAPGRARAIAEVHVRSWRRAYRGVVADAVLDRLSVDDHEHRWRGHLTDPANPVRTLVALDGAELVGFVAFVGEARDDDASPGTAEIAALYVDPDRWRAGAGRALLTAARDRIREDGARKVTLWVLEDNAGALAFYARMGLSPDGARRDNALGPRELRLGGEP